MAEIRSDSRLHEGLPILFEMVGKEDKESFANEVPVFGRAEVGEEQA